MLFLTGNDGQLAAGGAALLSGLVACDFQVVHLPAQSLAVSLERVIAGELASPLAEGLRRPIVGHEPTVAIRGGAHVRAADTARADSGRAAAGSSGAGLEGHRGAGMVCGRERPFNIAVVEVIREVALRVESCDVGLREKESVESSLVAPHATSVPGIAHGAHETAQSHVHDFTLVLKAAPVVTSPLITQQPVSAQEALNSTDWTSIPVGGMRCAAEVVAKVQR
eukprot:3642214-Rhodomonas_salina.3